MAPLRGSAKKTAVLTGTDAASYPGVVEAGSTEPIADNSPKTPSHRYDLRPRLPKSGLASSPSTSSYQDSIFSGGSSIRGGLHHVDTPDTDVSRSDRSSWPSPEGSQSEIEYFDRNSVTRTLDDEGHHPSRQSASSNGTAADESPSTRALRGQKLRQWQQNNRAGGVNRRSTQVGDDNYKGFPRTSEVVDAPEDGIRRHEQGASDELDEPVEAPQSAADVDSDTIVVAVPARRSEEEGTESKNTQTRSKSLQGRPPLLGAFGSPSDTQAETAPEQNRRKSRAKAKDDLSLPSSTATRRQASLPNIADDQSENGSAARTTESQILQTSKPPSARSEEEEEDCIFDVDATSNSSVSGENSPPRILEKAPQLPNNSLSAANVKDELLAKMRNQKCQRVPREGTITEGLVYVLVSEDYKGLVKIGRTTRTAEKRATELGFKCKINVKRVDNDQTVRFMHYQVVEKLVHAELKLKNWPYRCKNCGTKHDIDPKNDIGVEHGEWFYMEADEALEVVERWRKWMVDHEPYHKPPRVRPVKEDKNQVDVLILREFWDVRRILTGSDKGIDLVVWDEVKWMWLLHYFWYALHTDMEVTHTVVKILRPRGCVVNPKYWYPIIVCCLLFRFGIVSGLVRSLLTAVCFVAFRYYSY
jgi:hypothetical protein